MSDIPLDIIKKYNIGIIPLTVIFNNKEYLDGDNLTKDEFYKMLRRTDMMPKTSQATYHQFKTEFKKYDKSTEVLYIAGSSSFEPFFTEALAAFLGLSDEELPEHVSVLSTTDAYTNLVNGDAQVIFSATPTSKETRMAEMAGVDLQTIPIMNSGFVFFVSEDNPVKSLTVTQLYNIYCGTITNWKEVGGKNEPIVALQRTENSGSQTGMYKHVISKKEISKVDSSMKIESTKDIVSQVAKDSGAIGYSYYYYVDKLKSTDGIKMIPVNGVKPSKDTIATAEYPLTTYTCATIITDEGSQTLEDVISSVEAELNAAETTEGAVEDTSDLPLKLQFVQWILGEEGQKLVEKHGFIRHDN